MCKFLAPTGAGEGKKRGFLLRRAPLEATTAVFGFNGSGWRGNHGFWVRRERAEPKIPVFWSNERRRREKSGFSGPTGAVGGKNLNEKTTGGNNGY